MPDATNTCGSPKISLSRRAFTRAAIGGTTALALPVASAALPFKGGLSTIVGREPVVGFHADAPWVDPTGRDKPYRPPFATGRFAPDTESLMRLGFFL